MKSFVAYFDRSSALVLVLFLSACTPAKAFECKVDADCVLGREQGVCAPTLRCAYPKPSCVSGYAYPEGAGASLGGVCLPPGAIGPATEGGESVSTDTETGTSSTGSGMASGAEETVAPSTSGPPTSG